MDLNQIFEWIKNVHPAVPIVLTSLGGLVVLGQSYVIISPSKKDDAFLAKVEAMPVIGHVLLFLKSFAPIQKK